MAKRIILGESGGPTPVIDWEVAGAVDEAQKRGWEVYGMINGLEGLLNANIDGSCQVGARHAVPLLRPHVARVALGTWPRPMAGRTRSRGMEHY